MKRLIVGSNYNRILQWLKYYNSVPLERAAQSRGCHWEDFLEERNGIARRYGYLYRGSLSPMVKYADDLEDLGDLMWWEDDAGNKFVGYEVGNKIYKVDFNDVLERVTK